MRVHENAKKHCNLQYKNATRQTHPSYTILKDIKIAFKSSGGEQPWHKNGQTARDIPQTIGTQRY